MRRQGADGGIHRCLSTSTGNKEVIIIRARLYPFLLLVLALGTAGCQTIGPGNVQRDRIDYAGVLAESWKEQTLLNIVKLRYRDPPVFLEISSVISSYAMQSEFNITSRIFPGASAGNTNHGLGAIATFTDRPTISYTPLTGERFVNTLLRPIPPQSVFAMIQSGHQADFILRGTVRAINDVFSGSSKSGMKKPRENPLFDQVIDVFVRLQQAGALSMRVETRSEGQVVFLTLLDKASEEVGLDIRFLTDTLGIKPVNGEVRLTYGMARHGMAEISLLTRSLFDMLTEFSSGVDVPEQHLAEGRVKRMPGFDTEPRSSAPMLRVRSGSERPGDAYATVRYRDAWFWIDDRDLDSKRVMMFLMMFSSLAETGIAPQLPMLTIPAS